MQKKNITHIYKKESALTDDEKEYFIKKRIDELSDWWGFHIPYETLVETVKKWSADASPNNICLYVPDPEGFAREMYDDQKAMIENVKKYGFKSNFLTTFPCFSINTVTYNDEKYFEIDDGIVFTVNEYTNVKFDRKTDLLEWLKTTDKLFGYYDNEEFIEGYTDELVTRINDFFDIHGDGNLYVQIA